MCGIAGIFTYGATAPADISREIVAIRDAMAPRGPDGCGAWLSADGRTALGHRRLAIIDLREEASQPMTARECGLTIVFNGEIYNYKVLKDQLIAKGHRFRTNSDTEVLLYLYAEYGMDMCSRLRGMYAFAIFDESTGSVFLARDPFGIKPLYYADDGNTFRFASQVKALLAGGAIDTRPEPAGHVGFYLWGSVPEPYTLFRGIRALEPGSVLRIDSEGHRAAKVFCSIPQILRSAGSEPVQPDDPASRLKCLHDFLVDSVRHHLVADVPIAVFLSAGIDSQCIAALVRQTGHTDLRTLTVGFREYQGTLRDEVPLAEAGARQHRALHTTTIVTRDDFRNELDRFVQSMDQPTLDGFNTWCVSKAAAAIGIKVCLSGLGGDEMFAGYSTFSTVPRLAKLARRMVPSAAAGRGFRWLSAGWIGRFASPKYAGLFELGRTLEGAYLLDRGLFMPWELPRLMPPEMVREGWGELQPLKRLSATLEGLGDDAVGVGALEMCWYMRNQLLRDADWAGMAHSVEIRVPLVDVELLRNIAPYLRGPAPFRKSMVAQVCGFDAGNRPKTGFSTPVREWFSEESGTKKGAPRGLRDWARFAVAETYGARLAPATP
jgi:asparagine synthase (glutamine-hydrolysing)